MDERVVAPDVTEPIVACRAWRYSSPGRPRSRGVEAPYRLRRGVRTEPPSPASPWMLRSTGFDGRWDTASLEATHDKTSSLDLSLSLYYAEIARSLAGGAAAHAVRKEELHEAPVPDCGCGIWALSDPRDLLDRFPCIYSASPSLNTYIYGVVHLWGRVIPGDDGWRAQHARIVGLMPRTWRDVETRRIARQYGVRVLRRWPALTKPQEVASWTSDASTR